MESDSQHILDQRLDLAWLSTQTGKPMTTRIVNVLKSYRKAEDNGYIPTNRDLLEFLEYGESRSRARRLPGTRKAVERYLEIRDMDLPIDVHGLAALGKTDATKDNLYWLASRLNPPFSNRDLLDLYKNHLNMTQVQEFIRSEGKTDEGELALFLLRERRTLSVKNFGGKTVRDIEEYFISNGMEKYLEQVWDAARPKL